MDRNEKVQDYKCSAQNAVNRDSDVFIAQAQKKQLGDFFMQKQKKTHRQKCRIEYQPLKLTKRCLNSSVYTFEVAVEFPVVKIQVLLNHKNYSRLWNLVGKKICLAQKLHIIFLVVFFRSRGLITVIDRKLCFWYFWCFVATKVERWVGLVACSNKGISCLKVILGTVKTIIFPKNQEPKKSRMHSNHRVDEIFEQQEFSRVFLLESSKCFSARNI